MRLVIAPDAMWVTILNINGYKSRRKMHMQRNACWLLCPTALTSLRYSAAYRGKEIPKTLNPYGGQQVTHQLLNCCVYANTHPIELMLPRLPKRGIHPAKGEPVVRDRTSLKLSELRLLGGGPLFLCKLLLLRLAQHA